MIFIILIPSSLPSPFLPVTSLVCSIGDSIIQEVGEKHADMSMIWTKTEWDHQTGNTNGEENANEEVNGRVG